MSEYHCDNCKGRLSVRIKYIDNKPVFIPVPYTTNWGGRLCSTGCCIRYIYKNEKANKIIFLFRRYLNKNVH